ncbi:hypothetical protein TVAG_247250 [Trichomonas vaginalis G3]|uniref:Ankyrin repeat protein n=1 Tax=Trichomonas vaginalis (strain ATCC PRA-98 / G3) TaxID=412133 RepID=A2DKR3_TRIV3|nr:spectrin binding [Trichomonas vaginalis G3]EAY19046.1 hypothetical protein TVAG_247250 [Trichomonas vaginalis G3]KAI5521160.1 spectrin binding [Trichomonas vaginalis G3]|eukprot:XP_001580032.1 hypothetical protein [Trichomonas vaginalis G3]
MTVQGWYPIHYAASTGNYKCLQLLLQTQFYQENISIPIAEQHISENLRSTTALHVAVTNRCYAQAIMLISELPEIKYFSGGKNKDFGQSGNESFQSCDVCQLSSYGNSALHIAAFLGDADMFEILMNSAPDLSILNKDKKTPLDIAKQRKKANIISLIQNNSPRSLEELRPKYFTLEDQSTLKNTKNIIELSEDIERLTSVIETMKSRIAELETKNSTNSQTKYCDKCGNILLGVSKCPVCDK